MSGTLGSKADECAIRRWKHIEPLYLGEGFLSSAYVFTASSVRSLPKYENLLARGKHLMAFAASRQLMTTRIVGCGYLHEQVPSEAGAVEQNPRVLASDLKQTTWLAEPFAGACQTSACKGPGARRHCSGWRATGTYSGSEVDIWEVIS
jgi:hypothetical protein